MGLDIYLYKYNGKEMQEVYFTSTQFPEHIFKVGYFRSSYNEGGIDRMLPEFLGDGYSLGWIFDVKLNCPSHPLPAKGLAVVGETRMSSTIEEYDRAIREFKETRQLNEHYFVEKPDWEQAKARVKDVLEKLEGVAKKPGREKMPWTMLSSHEHFELVKEAQEKIKTGELPKPKSNEEFDKMVCFCNWLKNGNKDGIQWYIQALKIVEETINWVLAEKRKNGSECEYVLHWSK